MREQRCSSVDLGSTDYRAERRRAAPEVCGRNQYSPNRTAQRESLWGTGWRECPVIA